MKTSARTTSGAICSNCSSASRPSDTVVTCIPSSVEVSAMTLCHASEPAGPRRAPQRALWKAARGYFRFRNFDRDVQEGSWSHEQHVRPELHRADSDCVAFIPTSHQNRNGVGVTTFV